MPGIHQYEGAGLHVRRVQGIIEGNLGKIGASSGGAAGGAVAGPVGGAVGAYIGGQLGVKGAQLMEKSALKKSAQQLEAEMKRNTELSKTNLEDIGKKK
jgi:phage tail tape-measure protein